MNFTLLLAASLAQQLPPIGPPTSPAEAQKLFRLDAGLRMELVAAEPQLESPVAMAFDEDGRLWVVEMPDYPNGPAPGHRPEGRIKILEDTDGDGFYETSRVFAEGLLFANGLLPWKGGAIVTVSPQVVQFDRDGHRTVLFDGFTAGNPQLRLSSPVLGPDGWVTLANGLRGGQVVRPGQKTDKPLSLSGRDFRFDPTDPDRFGADSGMGQFGTTYDDWGHRFVCDNRHHLRQIVLPDAALRRNPFLAVPAVVADISVLDDDTGGHTGIMAAAGGHVYPLSKNWTTSNLHAGRFTASCGVHVYRGNLLSERYRGVAFTCEPTGNLVHGEVLEPHGAAFRSKPLREGVEFLATTDDWFRPVFLADGPDGALYVLDMGRAVIEHPEWMPPELKNRPDLTLGKERGRIWRIVPEGRREPAAKPRLSQASTDELVKTLEHQNGWHRTTAQRLLIERNDPAAVEPLRKLVHGSKESRSRLLAAWLLKRAGALEEDTLVQLLKGSDPRLRAAAAALAAGPGRSETVRAAVIGLASDAEPEVRFRVALAIDAGEPGALAALAAIALRDCEDPWTRRAVLSAVPGRAAELLAVLIANPAFGSHVTTGRLQLVRELSAVVGARHDAGEVGLLLADLHTSEGPNAARWLSAGITGLAEGLARRGLRLDDQMKSLKPAAAAVAQAALKHAAAVARSSADVADRIEAVRLLAQAPWDLAGPVLTGLLAENAPPDLRLAAVRALATQPRPEVAPALLKAWNGATPGLRRELSEALLRDTDRTLALLSAMEAGDVKANELDPQRLARLEKDTKPEVRERAHKLIAANVPADRRAVYERYKPVLATAGDVARGREVFRKNCASCHHVDGVGVAVGPDVSDTRTKTAEQLLTDILIPNQAIDANYVNYVAVTKSGRVVTGLLSAETAAAVTLRRAEDQSDVLLRSDLESLEATGKSLMPDGLEEAIPPSAMADLIAFLKNWRYQAPGAGK